MNPQPKAARTPKRLYILFDAEGVICGDYLTREEAEEDAWGPRFRRFTVREYALVPLRNESDKDRRTK